MADSAYLDLVAEGAKFNAGTGVDDQLIQYVHARSRRRGETASSRSIVRAVARTRGRSSTGVTLGVEIAQRAKAITGRPVLFASATTGVYGEVVWVALYDSIEQVQAADEALDADPTSPSCSTRRPPRPTSPGQATQTIARKLI